MPWLDGASEEFHLANHVDGLEHLGDECQARHKLANGPRALCAEGDAGVWLPLVQAQEIVVMGHYDAACLLGVGQELGISRTK